MYKRLLAQCLTAGGQYMEVNCSFLFQFKFINVCGQSALKASSQGAGNYLGGKNSALFPCDSFFPFVNILNQIAIKSCWPAEPLSGNLHISSLIHESQFNIWSHFCFLIPKF